MAAALREFDVKKPSQWTFYEEQLAFYFEANEITDAAKKRAKFLSACGTPAYELIRSLCAPSKPNEKTFDEIIQLLNNHFTPSKPSEIVQRYIFHKRDQLEGEDVAMYVAAYYEKSRKRATSQISWIPCYETADLTLKTALNHAVAAEMTAKNVVELRSCTTATDNSVNKAAATAAGSSKFKIRTTTSKVPNTVKGEMRCYRCGDGSHNANTCKYTNSTCNFCHKKGHLERVCLKKKRGGTTNQVQASNYVDDPSASPNVTVDHFEEHIFQCQSEKSAQAYLVEVEINGQKCPMEIDSGASNTIMSYATFKRLWPESRPKLQECNKMFRDFQRNVIHTAGICDVSVRLKNNSAILPLVVTYGTAANLLGRNWFDRLGITLQGIHHVNDNVVAVVNRFADLFSPTLGRFKGAPVKLNINKKFTPISLKARNVPFALRPKVEAELDKLCKQGILEPIQFSRWTTPIVCVVKSSGELRICGDYKCTLNKALLSYTYPVPSVNEILSNLQSAKYFAKLDMAQAFQQLPVDPESAELQTIITHKGCFKVNRLQFGLTVAPQI
ncbi:uncharacterized protein K02A2.6-like [Photinus pyralis]|uniref:uncharacterized protein K02A2.6-like n=1 Tax=Photinus pyralis TaxID=7054 RepID=UPI00126735D6|nr:uncharacterized protein K02A2.6-like [Photinus pyralis]